MQNVYVQSKRLTISLTRQKQPPVMPRPDLQKIGVNYRRIPVMSVGRDVYCDTRIILRKLEELFPEGRLGASEGDQQVLERLLEAWTIESGIFNRASQLIPADMPLLKDPVFQKDREDLSGRSWSKESILKSRPEALSVIRSAFKLLETTLLADGRNWVLKTDKPTLADIEGENLAVLHHVSSHANVRFSGVALRLAERLEGSTSGGCDI